MQRSRHLQRALHLVRCAVSNNTASPASTSAVALPPEFAAVRNALSIAFRQYLDVPERHVGWPASRGPSLLAWRSLCAVAVAESKPAEGLLIEQSAVEKLRELQAEDPGGPGVLRVSVEGGGCSGFQYQFSLASSPAPSDRVFTRDGATVVCDDVSFEFLRGARVGYASDLIRSNFEVLENPNAESGCGCGSSFVAK